MSSFSVRDLGGVNGVSACVDERMLIVHVGVVTLYIHVDRHMSTTAL